MINIRFNEWMIVAGSFIALLIFSGSQILFGVLLPFIERDFEGTRVTFSLIASLNLLVLGVSNTIAGKFTDLYGTRKSVALGFGIIGPTVIALGFAPTIWHLFLIYGVLVPFSSVFFGPAVLSSLVSKWFRVRMGIALSIFSMGFPVGQLLTSPLAILLSVNLGWRVMAWIFGFAAIGIGFILVMILREPAVKHEQKVQKVEESTYPPNRSKSLKEAIRGRIFWLSAIPFFTCGWSDFLISTHLAIYATSKGIESLNLALMLSLIGASNIPGLMIMGWFSDRTSAISSLFITYSIRLVSFIILASTANVFAAFVFVVLFGWTLFTTNPLMASFIATTYGSKHMSTIMGFFVMIHMIGGAIGAFSGGLVYDITGSYEPAFVLAAALLFLAVLFNLYLKTVKNNLVFRSRHTY
jgi:predicted MFS family arabinose efflux permease